MKISGFTFGHNLIEGGYPIVESIGAVRPYVDEIVAVDIESTDDTPRILSRICDKVLSSTWEGRDTTPRAFLKHVECGGDIIIFFEADEVYDDNLLSEVIWAVERGHFSLEVWRLQVSQNFQRCRQYPIPVHRIFPRGGGTYHIHPTHLPDYIRMEVGIVPQSAGYLWDCANVFRDNWLQRKRNQSEIWGDPRPLMVAEHFAEPNEISEEEELARLKQPHWEWTSTPFNIPKILEPLVGQVKYDPKIQVHSSQR